MKVCGGRGKEGGGLWRGGGGTAGSALVGRSPVKKHIAVQVRKVCGVEGEGGHCRIRTSRSITCTKHIAVQVRKVSVVGTCLNVCGGGYGCGRGGGGEGARAGSGALADLSASRNTSEQ